jgi:S-disulfanyl-L-cysteine oxidoreductase SoxD
MLRKRRFLAIAIAAGGLLARIHGQETKTQSVWDGVYSSAQATRGAAGYAKNCASCHGQDLDGGGQAPPLSGDEFLSSWNGMTVGDLFDPIQLSMPADRPGQLSKAENTDIVAFILKSNHFPAGAKDLPSDSESQRSIRIEAKKP